MMVCAGKWPPSPLMFSATAGSSVFAHWLCFSTFRARKEGTDIGPRKRQSPSSVSVLASVPGTIFLGRTVQQLSISDCYRFSSSATVVGMIAIVTPARPMTTPTNSLPESMGFARRRANPLLM